MYYYLIHIVAAKNNGSKDWIQIVVFLAMIAVYSLSGILKAKMKKKEPQTGEEKPHRPLPAGPMPQPQYRQTAERGKISWLQSAAQKIAVKAEKSGYSPAIKPEEPIPTQKIQSDAINSPVLTSEPSVKMQDKRVIPSVSSETSRLISHPSYDLLNLSDPESLRRAILHYEILGKPMSLRGPGEQIIGL